MLPSLGIRHREGWNDVRTYAWIRTCNGIPLGMGWNRKEWNGSTNKACIFDGIMDAEMYCPLLDKYLVPFIKTVYPHNHCFMQDNNLKHTSQRAQKFFMDKRINWWPTPPKSPDANPIENLWHGLKVCRVTYMYLKSLKLIYRQWLLLWSLVIKTMNITV